MKTLFIAIWLIQQQVANYLDNRTPEHHPPKYAFSKPSSTVPCGVTAMHWSDQHDKYLVWPMPEGVCIFITTQYGRKQQYTWGMSFISR